MRNSGMHLAPMHNSLGRFHGRLPNDVHGLKWKISRFFFFYIFFCSHKLPKTFTYLLGTLIIIFYIEKKKTNLKVCNCLLYIGEIV